MKWQQTWRWRWLQVKFLWFIYRRGRISLSELVSEVAWWVKSVSGSVGGSR